MNEEQNAAMSGEENGGVETAASGPVGHASTMGEAEAAETDSPEARIAELERELQESRETSARRVADLDNMRKRFMLEKLQLSSEANRRLILDLLPTLDDLERTIEHAEKQQAGDASQLLTGAELIRRNLTKTLERYGVKPIAVTGERFDVNLHDAMLEQPSGDVEPGTVLQEIQKGYMMNDTVLRHAKVVVSKAPDTP